PYLAPVPERGRRNEPAFMAATAARLAELLGLSVDEVVRRTTAAACALFGP
ncbi:MAG: TatD family hydrolase, partial [Candidatus Eremiobacteraeota bacterium]|nr:TatD family hydrolase [Candidatus Eremiobacteraeota bacterium]